MHLSTADTVDTATAADIAYVAGDTVPAVDNEVLRDSNRNATLEAAFTNAGGRRRRGLVPYNPLTGELGVEACLGEPPILMCLKGGGVLPSFKSLAQATSEGTETVVEKCFGGECKRDTFETFLEKLGNQATDASLYVGVSVCMGAPGLTETLNKFGISLCWNLLQLDLYPLQGPVGQLTVGVQLFVVHLSAWGKLKMSNNSPVCLQDMSAETLDAMCKRHPNTYGHLAKVWGGSDFCNMNKGDGILGATVKVDLWFYSKSWNFGQKPRPRHLRVRRCS